MEGRVRFCQLVVVPLAGLARRYEARLAEIGEMPRRRWLRNVQHRYEIADAQFPFEQQVQDAQPRAIGKCLEHEMDLRLGHGRLKTRAIVAGIMLPRKVSAISAATSIFCHKLGVARHIR